MSIRIASTEKATCFSGVWLDLEASDASSTVTHEIVLGISWGSVFTATSVLVRLKGVALARNWNRFPFWVGMELDRFIPNKFFAPPNSFLSSSLFIFSFLVVVRGLVFSSLEAPPNSFLPSLLPEDEDASDRAGSGFYALQAHANGNVRNCSVCN